MNEKKRWQNTFWMVRFFNAIHQDSAYSEKDYESYKHTNNMQYTDKANFFLSLSFIAILAENFFFVVEWNVRDIMMVHAIQFWSSVQWTPQPYVCLCLKNNKQFFNFEFEWQNRMGNKKNSLESLFFFYLIPIRWFFFSFFVLTTIFIAFSF